jgi:hypothetical protein
MMRDKILTCVQCEEGFVFSVFEQEHFALMGFDEPKRCPSCRKNKSRGRDLNEKRKSGDKKKYFRQKYDSPL